MEDLSINKVGPWDPFMHDYALLKDMDAAGWQIRGVGGVGELGREILMAITRQETAASIDPGYAVKSLWPDQNGQLPDRYTLKINPTDGLLTIRYGGSEEEPGYELFLKRVISLGKRANAWAELAEKVDDSDAVV